MSNERHSERHNERHNERHTETSPRSRSWFTSLLLCLALASPLVLISGCRAGVIKDIVVVECTDGAIRCQGEDGVLVCADNAFVLSHVCPAGTQCNVGQCEPIDVCEPDCANRNCGPDGCDGSCGACDSGFVCDEDGLCQDENTCEPDCVSRNCGPDGCNGSCGTCPLDHECNAQGVCEPAPTDCGDGVCDAAAGETCTTCPQDCDNAPWGSSFQIGQTVYNFQITGYADTNGDHVVEQVETTFTLSQMGCAGYKSVVLVWSDWCPT